MPGLVTQRAEGLLKLACGDFGWFHAVISILAIISKIAIFCKTIIVIIMCMGLGFHGEDYEK